MKTLVLVSFCAASLVQVAYAVVTPINCNIFFDGTNTIQLAWSAYPGKSYVVQTTTNLGQPWQTFGTVSATSNSVYQAFTVTPNVRFFKVAKLDTDGPEVYKTSPFDGAIGVDNQASLQAWLRDETGVDTNSIAFAIGTNQPVTLSDTRLSYASGVLTYVPSTNEFFGTNGQIVTANLFAADTLGNQTTNFVWSFQLELAPVLSTNIVFLGGTNVPCNLALVSTNGDYFTFTYTGSCCLTNSMQLVDTNLFTGFARTVVSLTNYPASSSVVALTRPTTLAELLQTGTLSSSAFVELTNSASGKNRRKDLQLSVGFPVHHTVSLEKVVYQDANFLIETTPQSQLNLDATLQLAANFHNLKMTEFQSQVTGSASFELDVHARASTSGNFNGSAPMITPIHELYYTPYFPWPVWVDVVFEVNVGYTAHFDASAEVTDGVSAVKSITVGRKWDSVNGWLPIFDNPPVSLSFLVPTWQIQGSADLRAYVQPKVTAYVYSVAGVSVDLEPYVELAGDAQLNPLQWDLGLYAGLDSTFAVALRGWDESLGELPSVPLHLIPQQTLWHSAGPSSSTVPPQIMLQPQNQSASQGSTVSFLVQAQGSEPLSYRWFKNGLRLTDDNRITGSGGGTLRIAKVQLSDAGVYSVRVSNGASSANSSSATLTVLAQPVPAPSPRLVWIPPGTFIMGSPDTEAERYPPEGPQTTVTISRGFWMGRYEVTQGEYLALMGNNPSWFNGVRTNSSTQEDFGTDLNRPVESVSWFDATNYCGQLTLHEAQAARLPFGWVYRLPTGAEWEYACRARTKTAFNFGNSIHGGMANFYDYLEYDASIGAFWVLDPAVPNLGKTIAVGNYPPNAWGLYDMHGNVWEWCMDLQMTYPGGSIVDPIGQITGPNHTIRGGGWETGGSLCRSAFRAELVVPELQGFRVVLAQSVPAPSPRLTWIPPGTFIMGSPVSEPERFSWEGPQTTVTISQGFWMGRYEVTQGEYLALMGNNPSIFNGGSYGTNLNRPVEMVRWSDATKYCEQLTLQESIADRLPAGWLYRLPTEAEWEYACRAGTTTAFHHGPDLRSGMANFDGREEYDSSVGTIDNPGGTFLNRPTEVGSYAPNAWGLYDMDGNVFEWCKDWFAELYPGGSVIDPQGPGTGSSHVMRGGGYLDPAKYCRSAYRSSINPGTSSVPFLGFRIVLAPK